MDQGLFAIVGITVRDRLRSCAAHDVCGEYVRANTVTTPASVIFLRKEPTNGEGTPGENFSAHMNYGQRTCWVGWIAEESIVPLLRRFPIPNGYVLSVVVERMLIGERATKEERAYFHKKKGAVLIRVEDGELLQGMPSITQ